MQSYDLLPIRAKISVQNTLKIVYRMLKFSVKNIKYFILS